MNNRSKVLPLIVILLILNLAICGITLLKMINSNNDAEESLATEQPASDESAISDENAASDESTDPDGDESAGEVQVPEPLIAIVDYDTEDAGRIRRYLLNAGYESERVGAIEDLDVEKFDAIIIPGGHSVTPSMYGAERDPATKDTDIDKDKFQFAAVEKFVEAEKPILGICRGMQLLNNVLGGTTIQDMPDGWHKKYRYVTIAEGTWMYDLLGKEAETYHYHHQCVDKLGDGLYATEWDSASGCIEAYEHKTLPIYGLQWHPDSMDETGVLVFKEFGKLVEQDMRGDR